MAKTRNQKRKLEEVSNVESIDEQSPLTGTFKRKKKDNEDSSEPVESDFESEEESDFESETEMESVSESEDRELVESDDDNDNDFNPGSEKEQRILNLKFNPKQIQEIIKESIKGLMKKYTNEDKEFIKDNIDNVGDPYEKFHELVESIYNGEFFERIPLEDRKKRIRQEFTKDQILEMSKELEVINENYKNSSPSIIDILKMKTPIKQKQKLLEKVHHLVNADTLSNEYNANVKFLTSNISSANDTELLELEQKILENAVNNGVSDSYKYKILKSKMSFENKVIAYKKLEIMDTYEDNDTSEYAKYKTWMDTLLSVPFGTCKDIPVDIRSSEEELRSYVKTVRSTLDEKLSFLEKPKDQIINIITQMIRNPDTNINAIGLHGPKGVGKSSIVASIAEALGRPYAMISLGGESDASTLTGHGFTYVGSSAGRLIDILKTTNTMNPIVLVDELDKVSQTHHGKEIIGTLIHLTDSTTNNKYNYDKYFSGIEFDLSKVLFIFTYNDPSKVDKILADRLYKIKVDNYTQKEKLEITNKHIIKNELEKFRFNENESLQFSEDAIKYLVETSNKDEGMRDIKTKFKIIMARINTLLLTNPEDNVINLKYKKLYPFYRSLPVIIPKDHIDILLGESIENDSKEDSPNPFMYM
jgi:ATP-dependent Lon protease